MPVPIAGIVAAAGIAAASSQMQQFQNQRAQASATKQGRSFALHQGDIEWARQKEWYDLHQSPSARVREAKEAGLHPLFAMGLPGVAGPSNTIAAPQSGSYAGSGIANAGRAIARGITRAGESRQAEEIYQLNKRLLEQQVEAGDIDLMAKASMNMRLQQELLHQPTHAQAFSQSALDAEDLARRNYELKQALQVTTPYGVEATGAYGGKYMVPGGVTPQEALEPVVGEAADLHGAAIAARMLFSPNEVQARVRKIKRQAAAARRQMKRGKRSRYLRGRRIK